MKVLVACEFSGIVREAFSNRGHTAYSCDLLPSERPGNHIQADVLTIPRTASFDLLIAFPPCRYLACSGARWFKQRQQEQKDAIGFVLRLWHMPIMRKCLENPIGVLSTQWCKPDQIVHPWQFGHPESKATCLWLQNLPKLVPTKIVNGKYARVWREPPGPNRWKNRSRTYQGIADAMAEQWG